MSKHAAPLPRRFDPPASGHDPAETAPTPAPTPAPPPASTPLDPSPTTELAMTTYDPSADLAGPVPTPEPVAAPAEEPAAAVPAPVPATAAREVTCPECGTVARVAVNRRESHDFCAECDFPLFWTPSQVVLGDAGAAHAALRRLPGTAGRTSVGSLTCPHCSEANPINAETCLRCSGELHLAPAAPPPAPAPVAAPLPPAPVEASRPVWPIVLVTVTLLVLVVVVVVLIRR